MNGQRGFIYTISSPNLIVGKDYVASVWVKNFTTSAPAASALYYKINGGAPIYSNVTSKKAGDWYLINLRIPGSQIPTGAVLEVGAVNNATSGEVYFDDFRFQPLNSSSLAYVYDPWTGELNYILDNNNLFSKYEYDNAGRLVKTSRETLNYGVKLVAESNYNYGQQYGSIEDWKRTGITRCQLINGVYTGFLEEEQKIPIPRVQHITLQDGLERNNQQTADIQLYSYILKYLLAMKWFFKMLINHIHFHFLLVVACNSRN